MIENQWNSAKFSRWKTMYESTLSECENITNFNQVQSACYMKIPGFSSSPYYALLQTYCFCPFLNHEIVLCRKKTTNRNSERIQKFTVMIDWRLHKCCAINATVSCRS